MRRQLTPYDSILGFGLSKIGFAALQGAPMHSAVNIGLPEGFCGKAEMPGTTKY